MSTPTGKYLNPIHPSASESHETHEWAGTERHPVESNCGPLQSPYAPKRARAQPTVEQDFAIGEKAALPAALRTTEEFREHSEWRVVDEPCLFSHDTGAPCAHAGNNFHRQQSTPPASSDEMARDLKRLAASVSWVQREEAAAWLSRVAQRRPAAGFAPVDAGDRGCGEIFEDDFWSTRPPEPERLVPPSAMRLRRYMLDGPLMISIVSIFILVVSVVAAPVAHHRSVADWGPPSKLPPEPRMASLDSKFVAPPLGSLSQEDSQTTISRENESGTPAEGERSSQRSKLSPTAKSFAGGTVATLQPGIPGAQASPPRSTAVRALDPEEIMLLMKQGEQFIAAGDVVAARLSFQRAAEAGDADAAIALGATYDPTALTKLGAVGMSADVAKARSWYQKAEAFGSSKARWRLDSIADR